MKQQLAAELLTGEETLVVDRGLRQAIRAAESDLQWSPEDPVPATEVATIFRDNDLHEHANDVLASTAQRGYRAGLSYIFRLAQQVGAVRPGPIPEQTSHGTLFTPYVSSEVGLPAYQVNCRDGATVADTKYATVVAIVATSRDLTVTQLNNELDSTAGAGQAWATRLDREGLTVYQAAAAPSHRRQIIKHTRLLDAYIEASPEWQRAIQMRTLAHYFEKPEADVMDTLLELGRLLTGAPN